jgi:hypothetical protein
MAQFSGFLSPRPPPTCTAWSWPATHSNPPFPTLITFSLCKNNRHHHLLVKTTSTQICFQNFCLQDPPSHLCHSIAAAHPLSPALCYINNIPIMHKQPLLPFISENWVCTVQFLMIFVSKTLFHLHHSISALTHSTPLFPTSTTSTLWKIFPAAFC